MSQQIKGKIHKKQRNKREKSFLVNKLKRNIEENIANEVLVLTTNNSDQEKSN